MYLDWKTKMAPARKSSLKIDYLAINVTTLLNPVTCSLGGVYDTVKIVGTIFVKEKQ